MPHANIWIRKENEDLWANIPDKSAFVNALIAGEKAGAELGFENTGRLKDEIVKRVKAEGNIVESTIEVVEKDGKREAIVTEERWMPRAQKVKGDRCPHGFNLVVSKCKYGCTK